MDSTPKPNDALAAARAALAAGDSDGAFRALRPALAYPSAARDDDHTLAAKLRLFAEVTRAFAGEELAARIARVAEAVGDVSALYDLGYALYEERLFDVAATLLVRANGIEPGVQEIVTEASSCLEAMLAYEDAAQLVDGSGLADTDPMCAYLSGFSWFMQGQWRRAIPRLAQIADVNNDSIAFVRASLQGMVDRASAIEPVVPLDERALTAWHLAINGSFLLHESPYGHDEPMRGRYAFIADSAALMHEGITRLRALLGDDVPSRVMHAPDRASRVLGGAVASMLERPLIAWHAGINAIDAVVVAWSLDHTEDAGFNQQLHHHAARQVLFVHASSWVDPFPYAPDVTTFLHQSVTHPFTGGAMRVDPESKKIVRAPADTRSDDALVAEIVDATGADESKSDLATVLALRDAVRSLRDTAAAGLFRTDGKRSRQRAGSMVASNRF